MEELLSDYTTWLREKIVTRRRNQWTEITTPFRSWHGDNLSFYVCRGINDIFLSDLEETITDFVQSSGRIDEPPWAGRVSAALERFDIEMKDYILQTRATPKNFAERMHSFIQAMIAVGELCRLVECE